MHEEFFCRLFVLIIYVKKNVEGEYCFCRGADDLLPLLSYVIVRSGRPQLVAECHVLEEFIHEG